MDYSEVSLFPFYENGGYVHFDLSLINNSCMHAVLLRIHLMKL